MGWIGWSVKIDATDGPPGSAAESRMAQLVDLAYFLE
jgi:hypothetical protein